MHGHFTLRETASSTGSGSGLKPPRPPRSRGRWSPGGRGPDRFFRVLEENLRNQAWDDAIEEFRGNILPFLFHGIPATKWKYAGYSYCGFHIEPRRFADHPRFFTYDCGKGARGWCMVAMPYDLFPERGTAFVLTDACGRSFKGGWERIDELEQRYGNLKDCDRDHALDLIVRGAVRREDMVDLVNLHSFQGRQSVRSVLKFRALPPELSWHFPGSTGLMLFWPEDGYAQPLEWVSYPGFAS
jgi:hypothetical protein